MVSNSTTRLAAAFFALALVSSFVTAPVAATPGDDGIDLGGDDGITVGGDGVSVGGDEGVTVGTDGVEVANSSVGDEESPVSADEDGVSVGGDEGVSVGTDGVSVADEELGLGNDSDLPTDDLPGDGGGPVPDDDSLPSIGDGDLPSEDLPGLGEDLPSPGEGGALPDAGSVGSVADRQNGSVDTGAIPVLETLGPVLEPAPTDELSREFDEEILPAGTEDVLGPVPFESVPADPQDLPVGSQSLVGCAFPVRGDDVPLEAVPGPSELPVQPPALPGVPTSLLTPEAVGGIALGAPPDGCEAYDPDAPSVDPTAPPTNVDFDRQNFASEASGDRVVWVDEYEFETEDGQDGQLFWSFLLSNDRVVATEDLTVSDGRTEDYVGLEGSLIADRELPEGGSATTVVYLFGSGLGGTLVCDGTECQPSPVGLLDPGLPAVPTGGNGIPCEVPAGEEVPELPAPPEQVPGLPDVPEVGPGVGPDPIPNPNYCPVFNPNDPPVDPENPPSEPYQERRTYVDTFGLGGGYTVGEDEAGFENSPSANRFYGYGYDDEQAVYYEEVTIDTGEREYLVDTSNVWSRDTSSLEGRSAVMFTIQNGSTSIPTGGELVCDGEKCEVVVTGDMGATDGLPPVYVDDEDGSGAAERNVDAVSEAAGDAAERVPSDELIGDLPDPTNPGDLVDALMGA